MMSTGLDFLQGDWDGGLDASALGRQAVAHSMIGFRGMLCG